MRPHALSVRGYQLTYGPPSMRNLHMYLFMRDTSGGLLHAQTRRINCVCTLEDLFPYWEALHEMVFSGLSHVVAPSDVTSHHF